MSSSPWPPITVVLAGNSVEFYEWCETNHRDPRDSSIRYIKPGPGGLERLSTVILQAEDEIVRTGTYRERPDFEEVEEALRMSYGVGRTDEMSSVPSGES